MCFLFSRYVDNQCVHMCYSISPDRWSVGTCLFLFFPDLWITGRLYACYSIFPDLCLVRRYMCYSISPDPWMTSEYICIILWFQIYGWLCVFSRYQEMKEAGGDALPQTPPAATTTVITTTPYPGQPGPQPGYPMAQQNAYSQGPQQGYPQGPQQGYPPANQPPAYEKAQY